MGNFLNEQRNVLLIVTVLWKGKGGDKFSEASSLCDGPKCTFQNLPFCPPCSSSCSSWVKLISQLRERSGQIEGEETMASPGFPFPPVRLSVSISQALFGHNSRTQPRCRENYRTDVLAFRRCLFQIDTSWLVGEASLDPISLTGIPRWKYFRMGAGQMW